jgi:hypothetical protein
MEAQILEEGGNLVLVPSLEECVVTKAEHALKETLHSLLDAPDSSDKALERRYETLKAFLEEFQCERLRGVYEPLLIQGKRVRFLLCLESGELHVTMEVGP